VDIAPEPVPYPEGDIRTSISWQEVRCETLAEEIAEISVDLPPAPGDRSLLVRLRSEAWIPAEVQPDPGTSASPDQRPLGVRWAGARLEPRP
jgi:hypothetical protein